MQKNKVLVAILLVACTISQAQDITYKLNMELRDQVDALNIKVYNSTKIIHDKHLAKLNAYLKAYTKKGDFKNAQAINNEIEKFKSTTPLNDALKKILLGKVFRLSKGGGKDHTFVEAYFIYKTKTSVRFLENGKLINKLASGKEEYIFSADFKTFHYLLNNRTKSKTFERLN